MDRRTFIGGVEHGFFAELVAVRAMQVLRNVGCIGVLAGLTVASDVDAAETARRMSRVGFLSAASAEPFRVALRDLGYVEGENLVLESGSLLADSICCPHLPPTS